MKEKVKDANNRGLYSTLVTLFHLIAAIQFCFAMYYDYEHVNVPSSALKIKKTQFGGKLKFLTFINCILQAVYFLIAFVNDIIGTNEVAPAKTPAIRRIKDYMFAAFAFPVALNVGITFWSLFSIDRELVFPKALDAFFPNWLNHIMHTNIMIFIVMELFTSFRNYPSRKCGLIGLSTFMVSYLGWIHVIKFKADIWVYPVLDVLNLPQRIVFFLLCLVFPVGLYILGEFSNEKVWVKEIKHTMKVKGAKAN